MVHRLRFSIFCVLFAILGAGATPVYFSMQQLTGNGSTSRYTLIGDAGANPWSDGTNIYGGGVIQRTPTNGVDVVNLSPIGYTLVCPGWSHTLHFVVPPDTNTWNVVNLLTNGVSPSQPINYIFGSAPVWTAANNTIYPNGQTSTNGGWISTGNQLFPQ
jgi:hypothetical protein